MNRFRQILAPLAVLVLGALAIGALAACGSSSSSSASSTPPASSSAAGSATAAPAAAVKVDIAQFKYHPPTVVVKTGGTVTWTNSDSAPHTATEKANHSFDTNTLKKGKSKALTFKKPGTYAYVCLFHPFMNGTVIVK